VAGHQLRQIKVAVETGQPAAVLQVRQARLIQVAEAGQVALRLEALEQPQTVAQAAPALLSSSTPYQAKPYLRSKALLLGNARQV